METIQRNEPEISKVETNKKLTLTSAEIGKLWATLEICWKSRGECLFNSHTFNDKKPLPQVRSGREGRFISHKKLFYYVNSFVSIF